MRLQRKNDHTHARTPEETSEQPSAVRTIAVGNCTLVEQSHRDASRGEDFEKDSGSAETLPASGCSPGSGLCGRRSVN